MKRVTWVLALLFVAACASAAGGKKPRAAKDQAFVDPHFECSLPAGWPVQKEEDGVTAFGPRFENKVAVLIEITYTPPGHKLYPDADGYIRRRSAPNPDAEALGWTKGPVEPVDVAGRKAKRMVAGTSTFIPPHALDTKEYRLREEEIAVPASKGFYVLRFSAPETLYKANRKSFLKVVASFKPKL